MRLPHQGRVFAHCLKMGIAQMRAEKIVLFGIFMIYATIMILYGGVVRMIPEAELVRFGLTQAQMIWYMGTTEFLVFAASGWMFKEVQNDFMSGQADFALLRPYSDSLLRVSIWSGQAFARLLVLFPAYLFFMFVMTGSMSMDAAHLLGLILCMPLSCFMMLCASYVIGASCLWFVQAEPASWLWQKSLFLLSAMLWPIVLYPLWLQTFAWFTPFPGMLMIAGNWTLDLPWWKYAAAFAHQIAWAFIFAKMIGQFDRIILRRIQQQGG